MKTVIAQDLRRTAKAFSEIEVTYDPSKVEIYDMRNDESVISMCEKSWGTRVIVENGVLYLKKYGYADGHTSETTNALLDA